jgi:hypothetical protein
MLSLYSHIAALIMFVASRIIVDILISLYNVLHVSPSVELHHLLFSFLLCVSYCI